MAPFNFGLILTSLALLWVVYSSTSIDEQAFNPEDIISRDVCIIGGGATGR